MDINEYAPTFLQSSYVQNVDEGRLYEEILRVDATDRDCTPKFGDICKYEILTTDQPFAIDNEGNCVLLFFAFVVKTYENLAAGYSLKVKGESNFSQHFKM